MEDSGTYVCYGTLDEDGQTFQALFDIFVAGMYMYNIFHCFYSNWCDISSINLLHGRHGV